MLKKAHFNPSDFDSPASYKKRLHLLGKIAGIGDWSLTFATNSVIWSDYLYEFYELERNFDCSALFQNTGFYSDAEKSKMHALMERVQTTHTEYTETFKIVMRDGRIKWHTTTLYPELDAQGNLSGLYGILHNITAQKQLEQNNSKEHFLYKHVLDRLPAELIVFNQQGQHIYTNHAAINRRKTRSQLSDNHRKLHNDLESWIPAAAASGKDVIKECIANKRPVTVEEIAPGPDGTEQTHLITLYPLLNENGDTEYLVGHGMDITAKKQNELELQRMAYVAEKTNGIVMVTDPDRKIIWINHSFERILGYRSEEVIGRNPASFLQGPETSAETIQEIARSLQTTGTFSGEILNYTKNGEKIWLYLNIAAVYDDSGKLINYVAVENDITLIKKAEQRLQMAMEKERELNRFKTQFVNLASHQFRTPLATIRSSIDLLDLKMESADPTLAPYFVDYFQKHKAIMTEETVRMTELMENILDIGRVDEGRIELSKKKQHFKQFMDAFVQSNVEPGGQHRRLNYQFKAPDKVIDIDEILLRNVLRNVVSNAFKYSEGKPPPELTVMLHENTYQITIKDHGIGIPEKDQPFLFQSFFRASNARIFPGTGLGLMIAKRLILLHGGDINCESEVGKGCTVTIQCT
ncbi:PAS domain S-box protein [Nitrosomonas sp.]|uniref:sensor histidine kinase n=1 Tax=Nitrosomonas sp. TaxID=42353 RepID=UPI001DC6DA32|nr:PAS domain S-box protein [Nitrosomonas sp.]MCB1948551.1 PAS domain S-box protein [Nitrosomonas sp.]